MQLVINLIQDIATPHNNSLIAALREKSGLVVNAWYAKGNDQELYQWSEDVLNQYGASVVFGTALNWKFIWYCISHYREKYLIVGWANINTTLLHIIFFLLRRKFLHWTDLPDPEERISLRKRLLRNLAYKTLLLSNSRVLGVGKSNVERLVSMGFSVDRVANMPIFVEVDSDLSVYECMEETIRFRYKVPVGGFLISAGSRLVYDKGYDLLIDAIGSLPTSILERLKVVIVGSGEELGSLLNLIDAKELSTCVTIENWLDIHDFKTLIASSDVFIHPARFDSYGGAILGMALGVPVVGSTGSGAAIDRICNGINGCIYDFKDTKELTKLITQLLIDEDLRHRIGMAGRETALMWQPKRGADILLKNINF